MLKLEELTDPSKIRMTFVDPKHQVADILTRGRFTRDEWNEHLCFVPNCEQSKCFLKQFQPNYRPSSHVEDEDARTNTKQKIWARCCKNETCAEQVFVNRIRVQQCPWRNFSNTHDRIWVVRKKTKLEQINTNAMIWVFFECLCLKNFTRGNRLLTTESSCVQIPCCVFEAKKEHRHFVKSWKNRREWFTQSPTSTGAGQHLTENLSCSIEDFFPHKR